MPAVQAVQGILLLNPGAEELPGAADGIAGGIAFPAEIRPEHDELPIGQAMEEGPVGDEAVEPVLPCQMCAPGSVRPAEEHDRFADGVAQIIAQGDGADLPVVDLEPLMAEHHPGLGFPVHIERAVQALPAGRGDGLCLDGLEGPQGRVRRQELAPAVLALCPEGGGNVVLALPHVALGRPVIQIGPEAGGLGVEHLNRCGPVHQILADQGVKSAPARLLREALRVEERRVQVIFAAHRVSQNEGVGDVHIAHMQWVVHARTSRLVCCHHDTRLSADSQSKSAMG